MLLGLIGVYILIFLFDLPSLIKSKDKKRTIMVYALIFTMGFIISLLQILDKSPITPTIVIEKIFKTVIGVFK